MDAAEQIREARSRSGLSQSRLAQLAGVPQPNISAYESGARVPRPETLQTILRAARRRPSIVLFENRQAVLDLAKRMHVRNVRVFGSSVHGADTPDSDVDLLVTPEDDATIFDLAGLETELRQLLGTRVDVVTDHGDSEIMNRIRGEAVPL